MGQVAPKNKGKLRLRLPMGYLRPRQFRTLSKIHVGEKHTVVGAIDTELLLYGGIGQADLSDDKPASRRETARVLISCTP